MNKQSVERDNKAAEHHERAAHDHREAAGHYPGGSHENAAHHAQVAHGDSLHSMRYEEEAARQDAHNYHRNWDLEVGRND
jgi:hypothetical protein